MCSLGALFVYLSQLKGYCISLNPLLFHLILTVFCTVLLFHTHMNIVSYHAFDMMVLYIINN